MLLALELLRQPLVYKDSLQSSPDLPPGMRELLQIAGAGSESLARTSAAYGVSAQELRDAARFFLQQVLLMPGAGHYRVLGVAGDADMSLIRTHHRLLMRVFHPDRQADAESWIGVYAARVNRAYSTLRDPASRKVYDESLADQQGRERVRYGRIPAGPLPGLFHAAESARFTTAGTSPDFRWRTLLPGLIFVATVTVALVFVGWVYLSVRPTIPEKVVALGPELAVGMAAAGLVRPVPVPLAGQADKVSRDGVDDGLPPSAAPAGVGNDVAPPGRTSGEPLVDHVVRRPEADVRPQGARVPVSPSRGDKATDPVLGAREDVVVSKSASRDIAQLPSHPKAMPLRSVEKKHEDRKEAVRPAHSTAAVAVKPSQIVAAVSSLSEEELMALLGRLVDTYQQGNIEAFMTLFARDARTSDEADKAEIRHEYRNLFNGTATRKLRISNLHWRHRGEWAVGDGYLMVRVWRSGQVERFSGTFTVEVGRNKGRLVIHGLYYELDRS